MRAFRIDWFTLLLLAIGGVGAALVLLRGSAFGVALTPDSALYVAGARNLMAGNGLVDMTGVVYRAGAPLFPLALALFGAVFDVDPIDAAGYLNAGAFGLTIFALVMWLRNHIESRFLLIWTGCVCALSMRLAYVSATAWTEPLFILFTTLSLFSLDRFLNTKGRWCLFTAAVCAAFAFSARYAGAALVAAACAMLLWQGGIRFSARVGNTAVYCIVAVVPIGVWMARNVLIDGVPFGRYYPPMADDFSPAISFATTIDELTRWIFGEIGSGYLDGLLWAMSDAIASRISGDPLTIRTVLTVILLIGLASGVARAMRWIRPPRRIEGIAVPAGFIAAYAVFCAVVFPLTGIQIDWRFLTPMYVPVLAAAALILNQFLRCARKDEAVEHTGAPRKRNWGSTGLAKWGAPALPLVACLSLWLLPQIVANWRDVERWVNDGWGNYSTRAWAGSDVIRYLNSHLADKHGRVLSNDARAVYLLADHPNRWKMLGDLPLRTPAGVREFWYSIFAEGLLDSTYLIWFRDNDYFTYEYGPGELMELPGADLVAGRKDGLVLKGNSAAFRREFSDLVAGAEPVIDSIYRVRHVDDMLIYESAAPEVYYHVSRVGNALVYSREGGCGSAAEPEPHFFLHVYPVDDNDLESRRNRTGFDNLDFDLHERGIVSAGRCTMRIDLPEYDVAWIRTGQFYVRYAPEGRRYEEIWSTSFVGDRQVAPTRCGSAWPREAKFFLHVYPVDENDLEPGREQLGFNKRRFRFSSNSFDLDGRCMRMITLPKYGIRRVRTGQLASGKVIWAGEFSPVGRGRGGRPGRGRARGTPSPRAPAAGPSPGGPPRAARANPDIVRKRNRLAP